MGFIVALAVFLAVILLAMVAGNISVWTGIDPYDVLIGFGFVIAVAGLLPKLDFYGIHRRERAKAHREKLLDTFISETFDLKAELALRDETIETLAAEANTLKAELALRNETIETLDRTLGSLFSEYPEAVQFLNNADIVGEEDVDGLIQPDYQHSWPFPDKDGSYEFRNPTPSEESNRLRSEFAATLPIGMTAQDMHERWHEYLSAHPHIWRSCHGGLADRASEHEFFAKFFDQRNT